MREQNQRTRGKVQHPKEILSDLKKVQKGNREKTTMGFSIEQNITPARENPDEKGYLQDPLKLFSESSVFRLTILEKNNTERSYVYGNIPVRELATITKRTAAMTEKIMDAECVSTNVQETQSEGKNGSTPAYTVTLKIGNFKNKTPAQILLENPDNMEKLKNTAKWLQQHMSSHADNKKQYDAIMDAVRLAEQNTLNVNVQPVRESKCYKIYDAPVRTQSERNEKGKNFVYGINVCCYPGNTYPYQVTIVNYYATCRGIQPQANTMENYSKKTYNTSESVWNQAVEQMNTIKDIVIQRYGAYELERSEKYYEMNCRQRSIG